MPARPASATIPRSMIPRLPMPSVLALPRVSLPALLGLCGLATVLPAAAQVEADALRRCRALTDVMQRVACYDAIALPPVPVAGAAPAPRPAAPTVTSSAAAPTAAVVPAAASERTATFGLPAPAPSRPVEADFVDSRVVGRLEGWTPATRFTLANGQVWEIADGSQAVYDLQDPGVRITRGLFGSFFIRIEGVSQTPRVRRVR
jgi:hypothetical protein